jgi:hypothetical protein
MKKKKIQNIKVKKLLEFKIYRILAPAEKSIEELQKLDESDEALKRYKGKISVNYGFQEIFLFKN